MMVCAASAAPAPRPLKIAVLLPGADSPFVSAGAAVAQGVRAAALSSQNPVKVVVLPRKRGQTILSQMQDAALSGADVTVGPLGRADVDEALSLEFLPLPCVALNVGNSGHPTPPIMMHFTLSLEEEARQIARIAVEALPEKTASGKVPQMRIFAATSSSEQRIASAYEEVLKARSVNYQRFDLTTEMLETTKLLYEEPVVPADAQPKLLPVPDRYDDPQGYMKATLKNRAILSEFKARLAYREPPYQGALLAMDNRMAALVKPRLPRLTKVWGTSLVNPETGSFGQVASLTYDLKDLVFVEAPLVTISNPNAFLVRYGVEMPKSTLDKRLFAFGVDAFTLACAWAKGEGDIVFAGTTGLVEFHRAVSPIASREGRLVMVDQKGLRLTTSEEARKPLETPDFEAIQNKNQAARTQTEAPASSVVISEPKP